MSAVKKFIDAARKLHAEEADPAKRWEKMTPLLRELIAAFLFFTAQGARANDK